MEKKLFWVKQQLNGLIMKNKVKNTLLIPEGKFLYCSVFSTIIIILIWVITDDFTIIIMIKLPLSWLKNNHKNWNYEEKGLKVWGQGQNKQNKSTLEIKR